MLFNIFFLHGHNSVNCTAVTSGFFSISYFLTDSLHFYQNQKLLNVRTCDQIFLQLQGIRYLQVSFCETNSTWRNDISCKKLCNSLVCIEVNTSTLSRVLSFTFFLLIAMKLILPPMTKAYRNTSVFNSLYL